VDRGRLPGAAVAAARAAAATPAARAEAARATAATGPLDLVRTAFGELLGSVPPADGDFFALGGHSLVAVQLAERLRTRVGVPLTGLDILEHRTPRALAALLAAREEER
ncbi:acyl carrier protein, partial [Kitasatospora sp. NPDC059146]|uniref:acyl carrier protein n=1 Tax=Kitasatospora sp. NPDC059146 TaxID=3346741 RepID=UPI00368F4111